MNANNIESKFTAMGARIKVREIASRWRQGDRAWVSPADFAVDIRRDNAGEFFELRVPTHLRETLDVSVIQAEPKQRHLLLFVRKQGEKPQTGSLPLRPRRTRMVRRCRAGRRLQRPSGDGCTPAQGRA